MDSDRSRLKLRRTDGQSVIVGTPPDHIEIVVSRFQNDGTQLEFRAPREVPIYRRELAIKMGLDV